MVLYFMVRSQDSTNVAPTRSARGGQGDKQNMLLLMGEAIGIAPS